MEVEMEPKFKITRETDDSPEAEAAFAARVAAEKMESDAPFRDEPWLDPSYGVYVGPCEASEKEIRELLRGIHVLRDRCAKRFEIIHEQQAEIMLRDTELANLREQIKRLEEMNTAQSEKIRFWTEQAAHDEVESSRAVEELAELKVQAIRIEGERNALDMVVDKLLNRLGGKT